MKTEKYILASISSYVLKFEDVDLEAILKTQLISEQDVHKFCIATRLEFKQGRLFKITDLFLDEADEIIDVTPFKNLIPKITQLTNRHKFLAADLNGSFELFGKKEGLVEFPMDGNYTINYFGKINQNLIKWLPYEEMELFCPEFLKGILYIDYSNNLQPKYINQEIIEKVNYPDKEKGYTIKEYKSKTFIAKTDLDESLGSYGNMGVPEWVHHCEIPRCPKTNRVMKFLIQIDRHNDNYPQNRNGDFEYEPTVYFFGIRI